MQITVKDNIRCSQSLLNLFQKRRPSLYLQLAGFGHTGRMLLSSNVFVPWIVLTLISPRAASLRPVRNKHFPMNPLWPMTSHLLRKLLSLRQEKQFKAKGLWPYDCRLLRSWHSTPLLVCLSTRCSICYVLSRSALEKVAKRDVQGNRLYSKPSATTELSNPVARLVLRCI